MTFQGFATSSIALSCIIVRFSMFKISTTLQNKKALVCFEKEQLYI